MTTLGIAIMGTMYFKGFFGVVPILIAMVVGYILSIFLGVIPKEVLKEIGACKVF